MCFNYIFMVDINIHNYMFLFLNSAVKVNSTQLFKLYCLIKNFIKYFYFTISIFLKTRCTLNVEIFFNVEIKIDFGLVLAISLTTLRLAMIKTKTECARTRLIPIRLICLLCKTRPIIGGKCYVFFE